MAGSGLQDLLKTIYAENSIEKLISRYAYARIIRSHTLAHLILANVVMEKIDFRKRLRNVERIRF